MARPTDPILFSRYKQALVEWEIDGAIILEKDAVEGLRATLEGVTEKYFKEALYRFVCEGEGEIKQVKEERENWRGTWEWHFDLLPTINGLRLYVETRLSPESFSSHKEPVVLVINVKIA